MARRVITLLGDPIVTEEGVATEAITPGYLVKGQGSISKSDVDGLVAPMRIALERDELGRGIDSSAGAASQDANIVTQQSPDYAIGDTVKVGAFGGGMRFYGFIASGQNITADDLLEAAGDGTFEALAGIHPLVRAVESVNATDPGDTRIRLEVI